MLNNNRFTCFSENFLFSGESEMKRFYGVFYLFLNLGIMNTII